MEEKKLRTMRRRSFRGNENPFVQNIQDSPEHHPTSETHEKSSPQSDFEKSCRRLDFHQAMNLLSSENHFVILNSQYRAKETLGGSHQTQSSAHLLLKSHFPVECKIALLKKAIETGIILALLSDSSGQSALMHAIAMDDTDITTLLLLQVQQAMNKKTEFQNVTCSIISGACHEITTVMNVHTPCTIETSKKMDTDLCDSESTDPQSDLKMDASLGVYVHNCENHALKVRSCHYVTNLPEKTESCTTRDHLQPSNDRVGSHRICRCIELQLLADHDHNGWNALHYATYHHSYAFLEYIFSRIDDCRILAPLISLPNNEGKTPLHLFLQHSHFERDNPRKKGPQQSNLDPGASIPQCSQMLLRILETNIPIEVTDNLQQTPLHTALRSGCVCCIYILLSHGANPNAFDIDGKRPIHTAFDYSCNLANAYMCLFRSNTDIWMMSMTSRKPLSNGQDRIFESSNGEMGDGSSTEVDSPDRSLQEGRNQGLEIINLPSDISNQNKLLSWKPHGFGNHFSRSALLTMLIQHGADPLLLDNTGRNALHCAALEYEEESFKVLLKSGSDPNIKDFSGRTALHHLASLGLGSKALWNSVWKNFRADPNVQDKKGRTVAHEWLSGPGVLDAETKSLSVKLAVEFLETINNGHKKADFNLPDSEGLTVAHLCLARFGSREGYSLMKRLIEFGCDINFQGNSSKTSPLAYSLSQGSSGQNLKLLFQGFRQARTHLVDSMGRTLMHYAARYGSIDNIRHLIEAGCPTGERDRFGRTPLQDCILSLDRDDGYEKVMTLLELSENLDNQDHLGISILHDVCANSAQGTPEILMAKLVKKMVEYGADPHATDKRGQTPLHLAARSSTLELYKELIKCGASLQAIDFKGKTPLHEAVRHGSTEIVMDMLEKECAIDQVDFDGNTILHEACCRIQGIEVIKRLLSSKRISRKMLHEKNRSGKTPLLLAATNPNMDAFHLLMAHDLLAYDDIHPLLQYAKHGTLARTFPFHLAVEKLTALSVLPDLQKTCIGDDDEWISRYRKMFFYLNKLEKKLNESSSIDHEYSIIEDKRIEEVVENIKFICESLEESTHKNLFELLCLNQPKPGTGSPDMNFNVIYNLVDSGLKVSAKIIESCWNTFKKLEILDGFIKQALDSISPDIYHHPNEGSSLEACPGTTTPSWHLEMLRKLHQAVRSWIAGTTITFTEMKKETGYCPTKLAPQSDFAVSYESEILETKYCRMEKRAWRQTARDLIKIKGLLERVRLDYSMTYIPSLQKRIAEIEKQDTYLQMVKNKLDQITINRERSHDSLKIFEKLQANYEKALKEYSLARSQLYEMEMGLCFNMRCPDLSKKIEEETFLVKERKQELELTADAIANLLFSSSYIGEYHIHDCVDIISTSATCQKIVPYVLSSKNKEFGHLLHLSSIIRPTTRCGPLLGYSALTPSLVKFSDFEEINKVGQFYFVAKVKGQEYLARRYDSGKDDQKQKFLNEVCCAQRLNHPALPRIFCQFSDYEMLYILYDMKPIEPFRFWIKKKRSFGENQQTFRRLLSAVLQLHSQNFVHSNISPDCIWMTDNGLPILFGLEFVITNESYTTRNPQDDIRERGFTRYTDPILTEKSQTSWLKENDVWSLGMILKTIHFEQNGSDICVFEDGVQHIPRHDNAHLVSLLKGILRQNPAERLRVEEIMDHPYFADNSYLEKSKIVWNIDMKKDLIRSHILGIRNRQLHEGCLLELSVTRSSIVEDVIHGFARMKSSQHFDPLKVSFRGEDGLDMIHNVAGGLTSEMYTLFFESLLSPSSRLFECAPAGESPEEPTYLPKSGYINDPWGYNMIGLILAKSLIDGVPVPVTFPKFLYKYLQGCDSFTLKDLEEYNVQLARGLRQALETENIQEVIPYTFEGLISGGEEIEVTDANKHRFVEMKVQSTILWARQKQMEAFRSGFRSVVELGSVLQILSPPELEMLVCGETQIDAFVVIQNLVFSPSADDSRWGSYERSGCKSSTPKDLIQILESMDVTSLRRFVRFATAKSRIPFGGFDPRIRIMHSPKSNDFPHGHCCFHSISMPDYMDLSVLQEKLNEAICSDGFGMN